MCGIIGYVGNKSASAALMVGLVKLEYRGYDSAGIAVVNNGEMLSRKRQGKLRVLENSLREKPIDGHLGIGHTRWATHGGPSEANAHPHLDCNGNIAIVHNGIIENYRELRKDLEARGHRFLSETDSEVLAHLLEDRYGKNLIETTRHVVAELEGSFAFVATTTADPGTLVAARQDSPLIIGVGDGEHFIASDVPAVLSATKRIIVLDDQEIAAVTADSAKVLDFAGNVHQKAVARIEWDGSEAEKGTHDHFMLKEIHEQPTVLRSFLDQHVAPDGKAIVLKDFGLSDEDLREVNHIIIEACGTSWHAGLVGRLLLERLARVSVDTEIASEFRYRFHDSYRERDRSAIKSDVLKRDALVIAISQSGETADTLAGVREARSFGLKVLSIVNVSSSTLARESDAVINLNAGPEIGVASTKAYTSQLMALYLFALHLGRIRGFVDEERTVRRIDRLREIPDEMAARLADDANLRCIASKFCKSDNFLFIGRGFDYPSAIEGALKLKEVSYIHAEGYPAGELKHGPIALVDSKMPVVAIATNDGVYEKMLSNVQEVKARNGLVIAVAGQGNELMSEYADHVITVPDVTDSMTPLVVAPPLQLLAAHIALLRGCDLDQPRNLAKSVTVE